MQYGFPDGPRNLIGDPERGAQRHQRPEAALLFGLRPAFLRATASVANMRRRHAASANAVRAGPFFDKRDTTAKASVIPAAATKPAVAVETDPSEDILWERNLGKPRTQRNHPWITFHAHLPW